MGYRRCRARSAALAAHPGATGDDLRAGGRGYDGKTSYVYLDVIVPASATVFVAGITARDTSGGPMLTYGHWADGAATLPPADLDPRVTRRVRRQAGFAVVCGAAAVLTGLRLGWP